MDVKAVINSNRWTEGVGITLFPIVMSRISGCPFEALDRLRMPGMNRFLRQWEAETAQLNTAKAATCEAIFAFIGKHGSQPRARLQVKRDLFNGRFERLPMGDLDSLFPEQISHKIRLCLQRWEKLVTWESKWASRFEKSRQVKGHQLLEEIGRDSMQQGFILGSDRLYEDLRALKKGKPFKPAKKVKMELAAIKYLSRACAKTTPFSRFSKVHLGELASHQGNSFVQMPPADKGMSDCRLNGNILKQILNLMANHPQIYPLISMKLNPTVYEEQNSYIFYHNHYNLEAFQKIPKRNMFALLANSLREHPEGLSCQALARKVIPALPSQTTASELTGYFKKLLDGGFLNLQFGVSGKLPHWPLSLSRLLISLNPRPPCLDPLISFLETATTVCARFHSAKAPSRYRLLHRLQNQLNKALSALESGIPGWPPKTDSDPLKTHLLPPFRMPRKKLIYEDCYLAGEVHYRGSDYTNIANSLDRLLCFLDSVKVAPSGDRYLNLCESALWKNLGNTRQPLLKFYRNFLAARQEFPPEKDSSNGNVDLSHFDLTLQKLGQREPGEEGKVHFQLEDLIPMEKNPFCQRSARSLAAQIQIFEGPTGPIGVVNKLLTGYGGWYGRFLYPFPTLWKTFRNWNRQLAGDKVFAENSDASFFNANLHPPLGEVEISLPGSQNAFPVSQQVPIQKLEIGPDKQGNPALFQESTGKQVQILNMDFQVAEERSPFFNFLGTFAPKGPPVLQWHAFLYRINHQFMRTMDGGNALFPRITMADHLVLQRKTWVYKSKLIPQSGAHGNEAKYHLSLNKWRRQMGLPCRVFFSLIVENIPLSYNRETLVFEYLVNKHRKPQFIDFHNPFLVNLFGRLMKNAAEFIKFEEMLPNTNDLISMDGSHYAAEFLLQWSRHPGREKVSRRSKT